MAWGDDVGCTEGSIHDALLAALVAESGHWSADRLRRSSAWHIGVNIGVQTIREVVFASFSSSGRAYNSGKHCSEDRTRVDTGR